MANPVTVKGSFACVHGGTVSLAAAPATAADGRLTVNGEKAVLFPGLFAGPPFAVPYANCGAPTPPAPCVSTTALTPNPGQSSRLTVGGAPVLLDSLQATSQAANTSLKSVAAGQSVLTAT